MLKKGGPDGWLRPGMSMKKLVTNSLTVCPKNVIKIWTFYKKKMKFLIKLLQGDYNIKSQQKNPVRICRTGYIYKIEEMLFLGGPDGLLRPV